MKVTASDVMDTVFHTLTPDLPVGEAVKTFKAAGAAEGRKIFGMMVVDGDGRLAGMISMYDILLFLRPKHIQIWGVMEDVDIEGLVDRACERAGTVRVGDIMSTDLITITPRTHLMAIVDIMINKHVRRLPVLEGGKILGIVYISDLFYHLLDRLTD